MFWSRPAITLEAFGGTAEYNGRGITPSQQFLITLNGPLLESVLIFVPYYLLKLDAIKSHYYIHYFLYTTMRLNILWCLFNLLPVIPLDGGRLAHFILERKFGHYGEKICAIIGIICVILAAPSFFFEGFFFFGTLLVIFGFQHFQMLQKFKGISHGNSTFGHYAKAIEAVNNNEPEKAKILLTKLLKSKDIQIKHSALEVLAKIYLRENEKHKSYDLLLKANHEFLKEGKCILAKLAFERENYDLVSKYSREIYTMEPTFEIAVLNSMAFAGLKQAALSGAWLSTASQFGSNYQLRVNDLLCDQIYDAVRNQSDFKKFMEKLVTV